jgi:hypothetical protein
MTRQEWINQQLERLPFIESSAKKTIISNRRKITSVSDSIYQFIANIYREKVDCQLRAHVFFNLPHSKVSSKMYATILFDNSVLEMEANLKTIDEIKKEIKPKTDDEEIAEFYKMLCEITKRVRKIIVLYRRIFVAEYKAFLRWLLKNNRNETYQLLQEMELNDHKY